MPSRVISARPRVIRPALPLSPKPSCSAAPGGNGDDVLERAAKLDADHVAVAVEPESLAADMPWRPGRPLHPLPRRPCWPAGPRDLERQVGPRHRRDPRPRAGMTSAMTSVMRSSVPCSMPLATDSRTARSATNGPTRMADSRIAAGRHRQHDDLARAGNSRRISRELDLDRERYVRQVALVLACLASSPSVCLVASEEHNGPAPGKVDGQGRAPRACPNDGARRLLSRHVPPWLPPASAWWAAWPASSLALPFLTLAFAEDEPDRRTGKAECRTDAGFRGNACS